MNMQPYKFSRQGNVIKYLVAGESRTLKSINAAKRESRKLQMANGGIGAGSMFLIKQNSHP